MPKRRYPKLRPKAVDLFCGAGGMSLGFEQAGFDILLGIDLDGHHIAAHKRNFPNGKAYCRSIVGLTGAEIREMAEFDGDLDLLFGGPPCQGFSNMGHRDHRDPRNTLVDEFIRIGLELQPKFIVMENVPGMLTGATRGVLRRAIRTLEDNYCITHPVRTLNAADFGVPQDRKRVFLLATRRDIASAAPYPVPLVRSSRPRTTVAEAISDLPEIEDREGLFSTDETEYDKEPISQYARWARGVQDDPSDLSIPRIWDRNLCSGCTRTRHAPESMELYAATPPGMTVPGHKLPRLHPDGVCPTLRAGSDSTRGSYTSPRPIHPFLPRCITVREAARLHGYPDWFRFVPTKWHAYKQIGNSVCPPVARAIGSELLRLLRPKMSATTPASVRLSDFFLLPEDRPRQQRRIPQVREFPPVIERLFHSCYDTKTQRLWRSGFSFGDVQGAIKAVGANLKWVRKDTFIAEIARSRNVRKLLAEPLRYGYSMRPVSNRGFIGEFVDAGAPGAIGLRDEASAKAGELANALRLPISPQVLEVLEVKVLEFLNDERVRDSLWSQKVASIGATSVPTNGNGRSNSIQIEWKSGHSVRSVVVIGTEGNVPPRSRVIRLAEKSKVAEVIVLTPVTVRHVLASRFVRCRSAADEVRRVVFALTDKG